MLLSASKNLDKLQEIFPQTERRKKVHINVFPETVLEV
jgi:hypothetical protein